MNLSVFHALLSVNGMSVFRLQQINKITEMAPDFIKCFCILFAGSLEAAYSLNWGAREIWGKGGGETLGTFMISRSI